MKSDFKALSPEVLFNLIRKRGETPVNKTPQTIYYEQKYEQYEPKKWFVGWNWAAFCAPSLWFLYRKMYVWFFVSSLYVLIDVFSKKSPIDLGQMPTSIDLYAILISLGSGSVYWVITMFLAGFFANTLYFRFLHKKYEGNIRNLGTNSFVRCALLYAGFNLLTLALSTLVSL